VPSLAPARERITIIGKVCSRLGREILGQPSGTAR
jgi:hypothetical protein